MKDFSYFNDPPDFTLNSDEQFLSDDPNDTHIGSLNFHPIIMMTRMKKMLFLYIMLHLKDSVFTKPGGK